MEKTIYDLELNERIKHVDKNSSGKTFIRRVPGGWVYTSINAIGTSSCFVPYHAEFKEEGGGAEGLENL